MIRPLKVAFLALCTSLAQPVLAVTPEKRERKLNHPEQTMVVQAVLVLHITSVP